jgi:hypothetical protein
MKLLVRKKIDQKIGIGEITEVTKNCDNCQRMKHLRESGRGFIRKYANTIAQKSSFNIDISELIKERSKQKFVIVGIRKYSKNLWTKRMPGSPTRQDI